MIWKQVRPAMVVAICAFALMSCDDRTTQDRMALALNAQTIRPADDNLAQIYEDTCMSCHGDAESGAPIAGAKQEWQERLDKGIGELLDHTIMGFEGMPPLGACADCSEEEFQALIIFMAAVEE